LAESDPALAVELVLAHEGVDVGEGRPGIERRTTRL
jgi:hypothetical protein